MRIQRVEWRQFPQFLNQLSSCSDWQAFATTVIKQDHAFPPKALMANGDSRWGQGIARSDDQGHTGRGSSSRGSLASLQE